MAMLTLFPVRFEHAANIAFAGTLAIGTFYGTLPVTFFACCHNLVLVSR